MMAAHRMLTFVSVCDIMDDERWWEYGEKFFIGVVEDQSEMRCVRVRGRAVR